MTQISNFNFANNIRKLFAADPGQRYPDTTYTISQPNSFNLWGSANTKSGEKVNAQTVRSIPAVAAALKVISGSIASLPLVVKKYTPNGEELDKESPIWSIVHDYCNDEMPMRDLVAQAVTNMLLHGRSVSLIVRTGFDITDLIPLNIEWMSIYLVNGQRKYVYNPPVNLYGLDSRREYSAKDIFDIVYDYQSDGYSHVVTWDLHRETFGNMLAAERFSSIMFEQGGVPTFLAKVGGQRSAAAMDAFQTDINNKMRLGRHNSENIFVVPEAVVDLTPIEIDGTKLQLIEVKKFLLLEACRIFNIPPTLLQDLSRATYSNMEQADLAYVKHTLTPITTNIEKELNLKLFGRNNISQNFVEFDFNGLERGDLTARIAAISAGINCGLYDLDQGKSLEGLPPVPNGKTVLVNSTLTTLENLMAKPDPDPITAPIDPNAPVADEADPKADPAAATDSKTPATNTKSAPKQ